MYKAFIVLLHVAQLVALSWITLLIYTLPQVVRSDLIASTQIIIETVALMLQSLGVSA